MTRQRSSYIAAAIVLLVFALLWLGAAGKEPLAPADAARLAQQFLDRYPADGGRIEGDEGDTVSEGQAYGLLAALVADRPQTFDAVWAWTMQHLVRDDGLLAWHWQGGAMADAQPATDADLDVIWAALLAAQRWDRPDLVRTAERMAEAVLTHETVVVGGRRALAAGPWAVAADRAVVNPSYLRPDPTARLAEVTGDQRWRQLTRDGMAMLETLMAGPPRLPPDWAVVTADGPAPIGTPDDPAAEPVFGYEAGRTLVWLAASRGRHHSVAQRLAASMRPLLPAADGEGVPAVLTLDGRPRVDHAGGSTTRSSTWATGTATAPGG